MNKLGKMALVFTFALMTCASFSTGAFAEAASGSEYGAASSVSISVMAEQTEYKYRLYSGRRQKRLWSATRECWIDPYWIDC